MLYVKCASCTENNIFEHHTTYIIHKNNGFNSNNNSFVFVLTVFQCQQNNHKMQRIMLMVSDRIGSTIYIHTLYVVTPTDDCMFMLLFCIHIYLLCIVILESSATQILSIHIHMYNYTYLLVERMQWLQNTIRTFGVWLRIVFIHWNRISAHSFFVYLFDFLLFFVRFFKLPLHLRVFRIIFVLHIKL